jgi:DNA-binding response OmpR family regulator
MPVTVVLAVGLDPWLLSTHSALWKSHGYVVISVATAREAIEHFKAGDFDLVLLGESITAENRQRLTHLIRAHGSRTPVIGFNDVSADRDAPVEAVSSSDPSPLLSGLRSFLAAHPVFHRSPAIV